MHMYIQTKTNEITLGDLLEIQTCKLKQSTKNELGMHFLVCVCVCVYEVEYGMCPETDFTAINAILDMIITVSEDIINTGLLLVDLVNI